MVIPMPHSPVHKSINNKYMPIKKRKPTIADRLKEAYDQGYREGQRAKEQEIKDVLNISDCEGSHCC